MRKSRFTESQIVAILKEGEAGVALSELTSKHGIGRATYFNWQAKYGGVSVSEIVNMASPNFSRWPLRSQSDKGQELRSPNLLKTGAAHLPDHVLFEHAVQLAARSALTAVLLDAAAIEIYIWVT